MELCRNLGDLDTKQTSYNKLILRKTEAKKKKVDGSKQKEV